MARENTESGCALANAFYRLADDLDEQALLAAADFQKQKCSVVRAPVIGAQQ
jgi:hypothetical protein